jgi:hypothetical protein
MKRIMTVLALSAVAASPAAAQWAGMPVWNSPKGGTGVTINGDLGMPNSNGKGTAFGARATLGLANLSVTAGVVSWKPKGAPESFTSVGGNAAFKIIGGSLIPVALNFQVGAARAAAANAVPATTRITAGGGVAVSVPTPGISIEPYLSITNRWNKVSGISGTNSNLGWTLGANANFGMFGVHLAYDSEKVSGGTVGTFGIGAHVALKAPIGM